MSLDEFKTDAGGGNGGAIEFVSITLLLSVLSR